MKTYTTLIIAILLAILLPLGTHAGIKAEGTGVKLKNEVAPVTFYNVGEKPPMDPLMILNFQELPLEKAAVVAVWQKEITEKIHKMGQLSGNTACVELTKILDGYADEFRKHGVLYYLVWFPRELTGGGIYLGEKTTK